MMLVATVHFISEPSQKHHHMVNKVGISIDQIVFSSRNAENKILPPNDYFLFWLRSNMAILSSNSVSL